MKVPSTAPPEIQHAFREVWQALDRWDGSRDVDLAGRRLINAGQAIDPFDYVTDADLQTALDAFAKTITPAVPLVTSSTVLYGTHAQRLARGPGTVATGTLFYETDRAAIYQTQDSAGTIIWALVMCRPLRTDATKPADLVVADAGFAWFDQVAGVTYRWSGTAWNYYLGSLVDVFANRPAAALADRGFLFIASDRGYHVWRKGSTDWVLLEGVGGPTLGTLANITTGLTTDDAGYAYEATDFNRAYRWSGTAWADAPGAPARYEIGSFAAAPEPAAGWALCNGASVTRSTATGGSTAFTTPDLITNKPVIRGHSIAGGTGGAATHTHAVDPPDTTSGANSTGQVVQSGTGATVAADAHTHQVDVASFTSGAGTSYPFYYEALPYVRI